MGEQCSSHSSTGGSNSEGRHVWTMGGTREQGGATDIPLDLRRESRACQPPGAATGMVAK